MKLSKLSAGSIKRARSLRSQSTSDAKYQALLAYATANTITKPSTYQSAIVEQGFRFATHNLIFRNNYVRWTGNIANQAISYYGNYASTDRLMVDPIVTEVLIEDCDLVATTWTGALIDVLDPNVNYTIRNCRIQGATSLFSDSRGGSPTGTLTDGGGNTFVGSGTIPAPTFSNFTATDFDGHGLLTEQTHHQANRGYRTQN